MDEEQIARLSRRARKRNIKRAELESEIGAGEAHLKRNIIHSRFNPKENMREVGMIPYSVFMILPEEIRNDNKKLLKWLQTDELGKYFKTRDRI